LDTLFYGNGLYINQLRWLKQRYEFGSIHNLPIFSVSYPNCFWVRAKHIERDVCSNSILNQGLAGLPMGIVKLMFNQNRFLL
jgi:hypothetical protein